MSELILALVLASAAWLIRGAFLDRDEAEVERLLEELEGSPGEGGEGGDHPADPPADEPAPEADSGELPEPPEAEENGASTASPPAG